MLRDTPDRRAIDRSRGGRLLLEIPIALVLALPITFLVLRRMAGNNCMERIADHEVAVVTDALGGAPRTVVTPGYVTFVPWLETLHRLERRPVEYVMAEGQEAAGADAPKLIVRGSDGTSFWFNSVRIQYALDPARAPLVLEDSGPGDAFRREIVDAYARAVLRDEFGRFTPAQIVEPDNRHAATVASREKMNDVLAVHGLVVLDLAISKPSFAQQYETTIERRKTAEQDLERMERKITSASAEKEDRLDLVRRELERSLGIERAALAEKLAKTESQAARARAEADLYHAKRASDATTEVEGKTSLALARLELYAKQAEGMRAKTAAFAAQGELAVRAALVERLAKIDFVIVPPAWRQEKAAGAVQTSFGSGQ